MLRTKGLSEKVIVLGLDGLDPRFSKAMVDAGKMPNLKKLIDMGARSLLQPACALPQEGQVDHERRHGQCPAQAEGYHRPVSVGAFSRCGHAQQDPWL